MKYALHYCKIYESKYVKAFAKKLLVCYNSWVFTCFKGGLNLHCKSWITSASNRLNLKLWMNEQIDLVIIASFKVNENTISRFSKAQMCVDLLTMSLDGLNDCNLNKISSRYFRHLAHVSVWNNIFHWSSWCHSRWYSWYLGYAVVGNGNSYSFWLITLNRTFCPNHYCWKIRKERIFSYQNTKSGCPLILWKVHFKNNPEPVLMNFSVGPSIKANASEI